jgi:hypothetical protein
VNELPVIIFAAQGKSLILRPQSPKDEWCATIIEIAAGPFTGTFSNDVYYSSWSGLRRGLIGLHKTLSGEVEFTADGKLQLHVKGNGRGQVIVDVWASPSSYDPRVELRFDINLDQTFLPPIIESLDQMLTLGERTTDSGLGQT